MKTYPELDQSGLTIAFEVEMGYVSLATVVRIIEGVDGVSQVCKRRMFSRWEEIHAWFRYQGAECVVWEPFGDSSRFWIGQKAPDKVDVSAIEQAFKNYVPPVHRRVLGDIITLQFLRKLLGRDDQWRRVNPPPP